MHPNCSLALATLALLAAFPAAAADRDADSIIVTATRQAARANELISDVSVITREEIEQAGEASLAQLLGRQPGIQLSANGGAGATTSVYIRGANANQSIVLVDGQRITSATSGTASLSRIPLAQIERIEILRGPASSLYGADAIGGVIQIFTRRGQGAPSVNASAGYGTHNTSEGSAGIAGGTDLVSYSVQAGFANTDGFNNLNNDKNAGYNADRDGYDNKNIAASLAVRPASGQEIGVNLLASQGTNQYDTSTSGAARDYSSDQTVATYSIYSRNRLNESWVSTLRTGRSTDDAQEYVGSTKTSKFRTDIDSLSWQNDIKLPLGKALLAAEYAKQKVSGSTAYTVSERTINSLLAGWNGRVDEHSVQFNLRRDDNSQFGAETTGSVAYGYQLTPEWRSHISYGTAFRAPTFNELYYPDFGSSDLKPERSRNTEIGANWERGSHRLSATAYNNEVSNLIETRFVRAPNTYAPVNVSQALLRGATFAYDGRVAEWTLGTALDLLDPRNDEDGANKGNQLARRAKQQLSSYLSRPLGKWELRGEWKLVGQRYDDAANTVRLGGYGLVNLYADYHIEKDWSLFIRADNIFNKEYETANDYAMAGASAFVGVRYAPK
jgi:vitamin B12 transporter